jgi:hypothetical protein
MVPKGGINRSALGTDTRIFRTSVNLYFFIIQQFMGRPLRDFALRCITNPRKTPYSISQAKERISKCLGTGTAKKLVYLVARILVLEVQFGVSIQFPE